MGEATDTAVVEMPGTPEVFADGFAVLLDDPEIVEVLYTCRRRYAATEVVLRVRMPRGAFEAARRQCNEAHGAAH